ncbi:MAG TPA: ribbon-helix-helix domain-containing protein [Stellaceae bacterium]|nr:ribbon-helix-helix domain-containing protein [Stellaceae bacterium]
MKSSVTGAESGNGPAERPDDRRNSTLVSGNVTVNGKRTSMRLEPAMWDALREVCARESRSMNALVTEIDRGRAESTLTAAIRVYLLAYFKAAATEEGHRTAGHGAASHSPV